MKKNYDLLAGKIVVRQKGKAALLDRPTWRSYEDKLTRH
jgi:hypothetical protein